MLFASSEAQVANDFSGFHVAFDPDQRRCVYNFSAKGSGDAMTLNPDGNHTQFNVMELSHGHTDTLLLQVHSLLYVL